MTEDAVNLKMDPIVHCPEVYQGMRQKDFVLLSIKQSRVMSLAAQYLASRTVNSRPYRAIFKTNAVEQTVIDTFAKLANTPMFSIRIPTFICINSAEDARTLAHREPLVWSACTSGDTVYRVDEVGYLCPRFFSLPDEISAGTPARCPTVDNNRWVLPATGSFVNTKSVAITWYALGFYRGVRNPPEPNVGGLAFLTTPLLLSSFGAAGDSVSYLLFIERNVTLVRLPPCW